MESRLADMLHGRLADLGLKLDVRLPLEELRTGVAEPGALIHPRGHQEMAVLSLPQVTATELAYAGRQWFPDQPLLILGPRVSERSAEVLRARGTNFLDAAGNAYIDMPGVHIDVRGRRAAPGECTETPRKSYGGNLFTAKRSQVIFVLLTWQDLVNAPARFIAETAGVSVGQAYETMRMLHEAHYVGRHSHLHRGDELLEGWAQAHGMIQRRAGRTVYFSGDPTRIMAPEGGVVQVSGEAALPEYLRPETATVYAAPITSKLAVVNRWRTDYTPNIFVRKRFWQEPDRDQTPGPGTVGVVPPALVYADLIASGDARQLEVARHLKETDARLQFD